MYSITITKYDLNRKKIRQARHVDRLMAEVYNVADQYESVIFYLMNYFKLIGCCFGRSVFAKSCVRTDQ